MDGARRWQGGRFQCFCMANLVICLGRKSTLEIDLNQERVRAQGRITGRRNMRRVQGHWEGGRHSTTSL